MTFVQSIVFSLKIYYTKATRWYSNFSLRKFGNKRLTLNSTEIPQFYVKLLWYIVHYRGRERGVFLIIFGNVHKILNKINNVFDKLDDSWNKNSILNININFPINLILCEISTIQFFLLIVIRFNTFKTLLFILDTIRSK